MLNVSRLSIRYDNSDQYAVVEASFKLSSKTVLGIFGRSGSGKTTLLKGIAGLIQPTKGQVMLNDEVVEGPDGRLIPGHEEIKMVYQDFRLKHLMTVAENIRYELMPYESGYKKERLKKMLRLCLLEELRDTYVEALSGGQKQRVAIARALATEPQLLLMDEPFSSLDLIAQAQLRQVLFNIIAETESAIVFVSHDPTEVLAICNQLLVLDNGNIVQQGSPREIYEEPVSLQVAELFSPVHQIHRDDHAGIYRPESFAISSGKAGDISGVVTRVYYRGSHQTLLLETDTKEVLTVEDENFQYKAGDMINVDIVKPPLSLSTDVAHNS